MRLPVRPTCGRREPTRPRGDPAPAHGRPIRLWGEGLRPGRPTMPPSIEADARSKKAGTQVAPARQTSSSARSQSKKWIDPSKINLRFTPHARTLNTRPHQGGAWCPASVLISKKATVEVMSQGKNRSGSPGEAANHRGKQALPEWERTAPGRGATVTVSGLTALLQSVVDNRQAVEVSQAATKAKVQAERAQAPSQLAVIRALESTIRGTF